MKPQRESVTNDIDLVLMTLGANDLRIFSVVVACMLLAFLGPSQCRNVLTQLQVEVREFKDKLAPILMDITKRMKPGGAVILVAYPNLITDGNKYVLKKFSDVFDAGTTIRNISHEFDLQQQLAVNEVNEKNLAEAAKGE